LLVGEVDVHAAHRLYTIHQGGHDARAIQGQGPPARQP
jgi:hypothetical protein